MLDIASYDSLARGAVSSGIAAANCDELVVSFSSPSWFDRAAVEAAVVGAKGNTTEASFSCGMLISDVDVTFNSNLNGATSQARPLRDRRDCTRKYREMATCEPMLEVMCLSRVNSNDPMDIETKDASVLPQMNEPNTSTSAQKANNE